MHMVRAKILCPEMVIVQACGASARAEGTREHRESRRLRRRPVQVSEAPGAGLCLAPARYRRCRCMLLLGALALIPWRSIMPLDSAITGPPKHTRVSNFVHNVKDRLTGRPRYSAGHGASLRAYLLSSPFVHSATIRASSDAFEPPCTGHNALLRRSGSWPSCAWCLL